MKHTNSSMTKYASTGILIAAAFGILLGLFLLLVDVAVLLKIVFVVIGIITLLTNLPGVFIGLATLQTREGKLLLLISLVASVLGGVMIFLHNGILMMVLGIYFLVSPLIRIFTSRERVVALRRELPKMILGVVMVLLGPAETVSFLFDIAGWVVIALTVFYALGALLSLRKHQHKTGPRVFVDSDGDGTIDTVYVDTTGDGKADTATRYRERK